MLALDDLLTIIAVALIVYILYKERTTISEKASNTLKNLIEGARKFVTFFFIILAVAFILGQLFAVSFFGYLPDEGLFYAPFLVLLLLILYYYMG